MDEDIIEQLQGLADDVVNEIDSFVPVIGNLLYSYKDGSELYTDFTSFIDKHNNDSAHDKKRSIKIPESVLEFLVKGKFKLILTTSPFDVLDRALIVRGVSVKSYYHRWGQQDSTNEIQRKDGEWSQKDCSENGTIGKEDILVYHLLGGYTTKMPEKESEFLDCLLSYQTERANSMQKMLSQKQILLLGSGIPNWLFLLLWYPLMRTSGIRYLFNYSCEENPEFQTCLDSLSFKTRKAMDKFLEFAIAKLSTDIETHLLQRDFEYDIFLSYKTEDKPFADKIYNYLKDNYNDVRVWYIEVRRDKDNPGEYYNRIFDGINQSRTFMPVIGLNYFTKFMSYVTGSDVKLKESLKDDLKTIINKDLGLITETFMALKIKNQIKSSNGLDRTYIIPVWDMDSLNPQLRDVLKESFKDLDLFQVINEYYYNDDNKEIGGLRPFKSIDWSTFFKQ